MLSTTLYINGMGIVCAAGSNVGENLIEQKPQDYSTNRLFAQEPDYTGLIPPMQLRRMSKAVRMSIAAAKTSLQKNEALHPHALSVGTAMGCVYDSEEFLSKMVQQDEQMLTPTFFIQSTHNTVSGAIALLLGCNGHNLTFVHRGHSFEHALLNASLYLQQHKNDIVLSGAFDEQIDTGFEIRQRAKVFKDEDVTPQNIYASKTWGSIAGEGAAFFTLSAAALETSFLCIKSMHTFITKSSATAIENINQFLRNTQTDIDMVLLGAGGDKRNNYVYQQLSDKTFTDVPQLFFKHVCGEYATASAVGLALLAECVQKNDWSLLSASPVREVKNIVFINNYLYHYSCYLLSIV